MYKGLTEIFVSYSSSSNAKQTIWTNISVLMVLCPAVPMLIALFISILIIIVVATILIVIVVPVVCYPTVIVL
jgi:hypothetical protein